MFYIVATVPSGQVIRSRGYKTQEEADDALKALADAGGHQGEQLSIENLGEDGGFELMVDDPPQEDS
jgi:hypothetical protein